MWMTYKQAQALGAQVRKGETGSLVVYADQFTKTETDAQGEDTERVIPFVKGHTVFNLDQIEGLPDSFLPVPSPTPSPFELHQAAEAFFAKTGATFRQGGNRAFYSPRADFIQLPSPSAFREAQRYAAVKAHELIHWTGPKSALVLEPRADIIEHWCWNYPTSLKAAV